METPTTEKPPRKGRRPEPLTHSGQLRRVRQEAGFTQVQLANEVNVSQYSISVAERTGEGLSEKNWKKLAKVLHSDVFTLRGWKKIFV